MCAYVFIYTELSKFSHFDGDEPVNLEVIYSKADPCSPERLKRSPAELAVSPTQNL